MATVTGFVEKIKFRNEDNGYTVMSVSSEGEEYILVGTFQYIGEGEMIEATGTMTEHPENSWLWNLTRSRLQRMSLPWSAIWGLGRSKV